MFIYDTTCCTREEDDPAEAICFLHCGGGGDGAGSVDQLTGEVDSEGAPLVDSAALHLICQLMGTAFFTERNMAAFPSVIRLRHGQFVLHREANFIWVRSDRQSGLNWALHKKPFLLLDVANWAQSHVWQWFQIITGPVYMILHFWRKFVVEKQNVVCGTMRVCDFIHMSDLETP